MSEVSKQILIQGYLAVEGDHSKIIGIVTLKDYHLNHAAHKLKSTIAKPHIRPDHTIFEVHAMMKSAQSDYLPVYDGENFVGVVSVGNITDKLVSITKMTRLNYQKVIHDVRNPIVNIQSIVEILSTSVTDQENLELLDVTVKSCKNAMDILDDLLFVEMDENKPLVLQETDMNTFFKECVGEQTGIAMHKNIKLLTRFTAETMSKSIDRKQFKRAIQNILSNAIKFSMPDTTVKISTKVVNEKIILKIVDAGIGIPRPMHKEIFKQFSTAQREGTRGEPSTGLGLWFTRQCIERHQGYIRMESEVGEGTKFYITI